MIILFGFVASCTDSSFSGSVGSNRNQEQKEDKTSDAEHIELEDADERVVEQDNDLGANDNPHEELDVETDISSSEQILKRCDSGEPETKKQLLNFPATQGCPFGLGDNLDTDNGTITARVEQTVNFAMPDKAVICGISLRSTTSSIEYDDFVYLLLDKFVLAGDSGHYATLLEKEDGIPVWDWSRVRGASHESDTPTFCVAGVCEMPGTEKLGKIDIRPDDKVVADIALELLNKKELEFTLISMGDNDSEDCQHTPFELEVTATYVK